KENGAMLATPKALDTGSVDVEIAYQTEVTADSVMVENADTTEWFGSINEALTNFEGTLGENDNVIVYENYSGEPSSGELAWPVTLNGGENYTVRGIDGAEIPAATENAENTAIVVENRGITIEDLTVNADEAENAIEVNANDLTLSGVDVMVDNMYGVVVSSGVENLTVNKESSITGNSLDNDYGIKVIDGATGTLSVDETDFEDLRNGIEVLDNNIAVDVTNSGFTGISDMGLYTEVTGENLTGNYTVENTEFMNIGTGVKVLADNLEGAISVNYNNFENAGADNWAVWLDEANDGAGVVNLENNWWNDEGGPVADEDEDDTRGDNFKLSGTIDTSITPWLNAPYPNTETTKSIEFDRDIYAGMKEVTVTARYGYKLGDDSVDVDVGSENANENITLTLAATDDTGVFDNTFMLTDNETLYNEEDGYLLVDNVMDNIIARPDDDWNEWNDTAEAVVDILPPVMDNIVIAVGDQGWTYEGKDNTWAENKIWARGSVEITANFTENSPENMVFTIGEREIVEDLEAGDNSVTVSEYVTRVPDGTLPITATLTDRGGLTDTLEKDIIVDTTPPDVEVVGPEQVGFGPNVENTDIPIQVDADDNVIDNVAGSGVETVTVDVPALENDISLTYNSESGYWESSITASVEDLASFEVTATATDRLAQSDDATGTVDVRWDNTAPAIENVWVVYPEGFNAAKVGDTVIVKATVTDDVEVGSVRLNAENVGLGSEIEMTLVDGDVYSAELEDIDVAEENLGLRQLTVTALDTANNEATGIVDVNVVGYYESYEITLEKGWNLISLPIIPENTATEAILAGLGDAVDNVVSVWGYDALDGQWMTYTPGVPTPPTFPSLRVMEDGKAYWVKMEETATLEIEGREMPVGGGGVIPPTYVLRTGWNLVGFTGVTQKTRDAYLGMVEEQVTGMTVFGYDTDKGLYTVRPSTMLTPGQGYWVFVTEKAAFTAW
ncbi:hypothetical protein AKJ37_06200, partial [candidate division MSBL1 archaeon SCGC-AAA259I09]